MIQEVTQKNVHIFIPRKVAVLVCRYAKQADISPKEALINFYKSKTYYLLSQERSKLWQFGDNYLYEEFLENN
jgi:hypothetical protein